MRETSVVEVNLSAIGHNMALLRAAVGDTCALCPIVKADAYGLGAVRVARRLVASGAEMLAVYSAEQAAALARAGVAAPVLVLMPIHEIRRSDELHRALAGGRLHLVAHDSEHLGCLERIAARLGVVVPVHVEVDTGLARGGALPEEAGLLIRRAALGPGVRLAGVLTHFSDGGGDPRRTSEQLSAFDRTVAGAGSAIGPDCLLHVASTATLLRHPRFHRSMVRFGLAWAGYAADEGAVPGQFGDDPGESALHGAALRLQPCIAWSSRLVQVKTVAAGTRVGYGGRWVAHRRSVLGLVPVGYADGYPRSAGGREVGGAVVTLLDRAGRRVAAPVVGAINMDQITIDLTELSESTELRVGARVELIAPDRAAPNHLPRLAAAAGTIPHELLCRIAGSRRVHVGEDSLTGAGDAPALATAGAA